MQNQKILIGGLFAIGATAIWSGNFIIARGLSESIPPISLAFYRWFIATIVLLPFTIKRLICDKDILKKNIGYLSLTSLLGITTFNTLIYTAGHTTTAINLSLISITFPIFIIILARIFFQEKITVHKSIGILFVLFGVLLLISKGDIYLLINLSFFIGDLWMLIASLIFAIYSILLRQKPRALSVWSLQSSTFILGLLFLFPFYIWEYSNTPAIAFDLTIISAILYVGIFASLTAFIFWNKAVEMTGPSKAGMIYYTLPLFSGFLAYLFLKEEIGVVHLYSILFIMPGILLANYEPKNIY